MTGNCIQRVGVLSMLLLGFFPTGDMMAQHQMQEILQFYQVILKGCTDAKVVTFRSGSLGCASRSAHTASSFPNRTSTLACVCIFEVLYVLNTLMQTFQNKVLAPAVTS
ncbi:hypothetical protein HanIR_Chr02g0068141 [Helianthus annuus]|nr:hypothetical protein HanIR_Chr02g0068141 [Helianthus annuus]